MKRILFIAITLFGIIPISTKVLAQSKIIPGRPESKIQSPFTDRLELIFNKRAPTVVEFEKKFSVEVKLENNMKEGNLVKFTASEPVEKVLIYVYTTNHNPNDGPTSGFEVWTNYNAGTTNGIFYLDAPSYAGRKFYDIGFFVKGSKGSLWETRLERKKPATLNKLPKKIPN